MVYLLQESTGEPSRNVSVRHEYVMCCIVLGTGKYMDGNIMENIQVINVLIFLLILNIGSFFQQYILLYYDVSIMILKYSTYLILQIIIMPPHNSLTPRST